MLQAVEVTSRTSCNGANDLRDLKGNNPERWGEELVCKSVHAPL
jgi:hypothetical protein